MEKWEKFLEGWVNGATDNEDHKEINGPQYLREFVGQQSMLEDLKVHISSALKHNKALNHVALFGPPGLGKTTLARIISNEMCSSFVELTGHTINPKSLEGVLFYLNEGDILFVDEIHAIKTKVAELLYSPMQDFTYEGFSIPRFTLIGATTNLGKLPKPMIDRIIHRYDFTLYSTEDIVDLLRKQGIAKQIATFIAERAKGVPRHAVQFLLKIRGYVDKYDADKITIKHCKEAFGALHIDEIGLNRMDRNFLAFLEASKAISSTSAVGLKTIIASLDLTEDIFSNMIEPYLLSQGYILRTPRGRIITPKGVKYIRKYR